ncbi:hypothetical protein [Mycobacterium sp. 1081908.1]|uniref:hypothetical protein n=1 Tax=Mycobacterium sp. 1081908.1 TaxID=1834066 RepID=UPI000B130367|nr:hypothetical protein [Mycobacterium sp. 1081908.1]
MNTVLPATDTRCRIDLEGWDAGNADRIWSDSRPASFRTAFIEFGELLAQHVDDPASVALIIPVDMADAVRRREDGPSYTAQRGSGFVSARTMSMPGGRVDVILNPGWLHAFDTPDHIRHAMRDIRRCLVHEAQHVIMHQRGSGFDAYAYGAESGATNQEFARCAAKVCDEHRAEWQAIQLTEHEPVTAGDVVPVLEALGSQLAAAHDGYQAAPQRPGAISELAGAALSSCVNLWTTLGYWIAQYRADDANIADIPAEIRGLPLWERYVGDVWSVLWLDGLRTLPVENLTTSPEILCVAMRNVAATLRTSLETIGFRYYDDSDLGPIFRIIRFDFPH